MPKASPFSSWVSPVVVAVVVVAAAVEPVHGCHGRTDAGSGSGSDCDSNNRSPGPFFW